MSESTTQCPRCRTAFRVTAAQLQAAAGAVRCGSCMYIFDANAHRIEPPANTEPSSPSDTASNPPDSAASIPPAIDDDDAVFDDGFDDEQDATPEAIAAQESTAQRYNHSFLDLDDWEEEPRSIFSDMDELDTELESDEQWAHQLLRELEEEDEEQPHSAPAQRGIDPVLESVAEFDEAGIEEPEDDPALSGDSRDDSFDNSFDTSLRAQRDDALAPLPPLRAEPRSSHRQLLDLEPEPLQLSRETPDAGRGRGWLYALLAAVAAIALGGQYLFYNFDRIALGPQRAQITRLCDWVGCQLPQRSAPESIRVGSLMVRSHPDRAEALVVDAIITNQAPFAQPYPALLLVFSDLSGAVMAARSFQPHEYLAGELSGSDEMASRQPVHIALELVDPGPRAVNYELHLEAAPETGSTLHP